MTRTTGRAALLVALVAGTVTPLVAQATVVKRALVIGNAKYTKGALNNPPNDASAVARTLRSIGFVVTQKNDLTRTQTRAAVNGFVTALGPSDLALVFYAGHAVELKGKNYLLPVNFAAQNEDDAVDDAYALDTLMSRLSRGRSGVNVVILDACRDDPFTRSWSRSASSRGLREVDQPAAQSYLAFSTAPGSTAADGSTNNSPYTTALIAQLTRPGVEIDLMFRNVRAHVRRLTANKQDPWSRNNLLGAVYLVPGAAPAAVAVATTAPSTPVATPSPPSGVGRFRVEFVHSKPAGIELGRTEVTVAQYEACVAAGACKKDSFRTRSDHKYCNWGHDDRGAHPMNCVTWYGARDFCAAAGGRLPTEQEWEAEASDGGRREYAWGSQAASCALAVMDDGKTKATAGAETDGCGHDSTAPVCSRSAGASVSKLCDMSGNVWEWTSTEEPGSRVLRGGSWGVVNQDSLRAAGRNRYDPTGRLYDIGFRCAR